MSWFKEENMYIVGFLVLEEWTMKHGGEVRSAEVVAVGDGRWVR